MTHQGYAPHDRPLPGARSGGHPEQHEPGAARGTGAAAGAVYGDWQGVPRARSAGPRPSAAPPAPVPVQARSAVLDGDTPAFGTPAVGFPRITLDPPPAPRRAEPDPFTAAAFTSTSTGARPRVPGPRLPVEPPRPAEAAEIEEAAAPPGSGRGRRLRTYTGLAAVAVTTVLAVVVAGQVASDDDAAGPGALAAPGGSPSRASDSHAAGSRSEDRMAPQGPARPEVPVAAPELTYEQKMAERLPIEEKLAGPGTFDTVPGIAKAPGRGKLVRYRVDVEQGLGMDAQLFAEAVHRTLNDPRSWGHGGARTFERVPGGEADFVITLASPGTTGVWCAKSGLDTTVDNVSCDSAATDRVMINAFRWAQGSVTYGPDQMLAYRQMLINHEVGHRLGHGHVSCRTAGALAPIMQQQTKSLDIDGIPCKPNPWVFPGN
ncbi:DUF3152 domain-containing protein [Streptomyces sp. NPDC058655]|uniref:DUF3152 domain-containing protein n=1 Tax=Streptomyces sp. NPDC058655 TaxID=3346577 RepID=UPI00365FD6D7